MLELSRQTVRHSWQPYAGAFVALGCGVVLIAMAVTLIGAVDMTSRRAGITAERRVQLDDLASMFGMMSGVALFMAMFVVASTFGFVVAARRRELGLLRLVGATPRQVRRMVLGEAGVVALLARSSAALLATVVTPAFSRCCAPAGSWTSSCRCRHRGSRGRCRCRSAAGSRWSGAGERPSAPQGVARGGSPGSGVERNRPGFWQA